MASFILIILNTFVLLSVNKHTCMHKLFLQESMFNGNLNLKKNKIY